MKTCGCTLTATIRDGFVHGAYCPMHAAASEMLAWIREIVGNDMPGYLTRMERGRALLARIDGDAS